MKYFLLFFLFALCAQVSSQESTPQGATPFKRNKPLPDPNVKMELVESGFTKTVDGKEVLVGTYSLAMPGGGPLETGTYDESGKKIGLWKKYSHTGAITLEAHYRGDQLNGPFTAFAPTGAILVKGFYVNGRPDGLLVKFTPDGRVAKVERHKDGQIIESIEGQ